MPNHLIEKAKRFPIVDLLDYMGHRPVYETTGGEMVYKSPFRDETLPSFFVNVKKNVFKDFGDDDYRGDVISLFRSLTGSNFPTAISSLVNNSIHITTGRMVEVKPIQVRESGMTIKSVRPVSNPNILMYAEKRGISAGVLQQYCLQATYQQNISERVYTSLAFANDLGGYELRSPGFKSCHGHKAISTIKSATVNENRAMLFEGFFDFLSYVEIFGTPSYTVIVLNSLSNLKKTDLTGFDVIDYYFDNDKPGINAGDWLQKNHARAYDNGWAYTGFNDLNDYLTNKHESKSTARRQ